MIDIRRQLRLQAFDEETFAPYGKIIRPPSQAGQREFYTDVLSDPHPGTTMRVHTNKVGPSLLPYEVAQLERHPRTAQMFIPLDVSRYVIIVCPPDRAGAPDQSAAIGMIVPGDRGVTFARGTWHASAAVLDRFGSFFVLQHRDDTPADDEFYALAEPFDVQA